MIIKGLEHDTFLAIGLVRSYAIFYNVEDIQQLFDKVCQQNVFLWNAMIRRYANKGTFDESLDLYYPLEHDGDIQL